MDGLVLVNVNWAVLFLTQTSVGILGNSVLFCLYNFSLFSAQVLRLIDTILTQLLLANILVLLSKGVPQTMAAFGLKGFLDGTGCPLVFYLHRVARGVTLSTTCLLSCFQAIVIGHSSSGWMETKIKSRKYLGFCCFLCWLLNFLINAHTVVNVAGPKNSRNMSIQNVYRYCYAPLPKGQMFTLLATIYVLTDWTFLVLMVWASGSLVLLLHRHQQHVQHIHSQRLSPTCPEARASCTVLALVSMFVSFYALAGMLSLWITQTPSPSRWLMNAVVLLSSAYPAFSPLVFLFRDTHVSQLCLLPWTRNTARLFSRL